MRIADGGRLAGWLCAAVATIEDTIVAKLEWSEHRGGSARQLDDVRELVKLAGTRIDSTYIDACVAELGLVEAWQNLDRGAS